MYLSPPGEHPCARTLTLRLHRTASDASTARPRLAGRRFITTRWDLVLASGERETPQSQRALEELCRLYWDPTYILILHLLHSEDQARDETQEFFTQLLRRNDLAVLDPRRGRFRSWLMQAVKRHIWNSRAQKNAEKRGGGVPHLQGEEGEHELGKVHARGLTPDRACMRTWALTILNRVLVTLREEQKGPKGKARFEKLKGTLPGATSKEYEHIAQELGMTPGAVKTQASRLRERYRQLLRMEIRHTVHFRREVDDELRVLRNALRDM